MNLLFIGEGDYAVKALKWTASRDNVEIVGVIGDNILEGAAKDSGFRCYHLEEVIDKIQQNHNWVELVISFLCRHILKSPIIDIPRYGCINFHPAPLPDYRGRAGCSFAILEKLGEWGCTAHYVDEGIDTGDIIKVIRFPFSWRTETGLSLKKKTLEVQCGLYEQVITMVLAEGRVACTPQDLHQGKYISSKDMLAAMKIEDANDIDAKIQAFWFPPHEGAYIEMPEGQRYTLVNKFILQQFKEVL